MTRKEQISTTVYFDGLCRLCSREIDHYRTRKGAENLKFVDITSAGFDAKAEGLDPYRVHQVMHVRRPDGSLATKVDAFVAIWSALPGYQWAARAANWSWVRLPLNVGYLAFAQVRPWLPRKSVDCETSPYCEINK